MGNMSSELELATCSHQPSDSTNRFCTSEVSRSHPSCGKQQKASSSNNDQLKTCSVKINGAFRELTESLVQKNLVSTNHLRCWCFGFPGPLLLLSQSPWQLFRITAVQLTSCFAWALHFAQQESCPLCACYAKQQTFSHRQCAVLLSTCSSLL